MNELEKAFLLGGGLGVTLTLIAVLLLVRTEAFKAAFVLWITRRRP